RLDFQKMDGRAAAGHVSNATQEDGAVYNVQPLMFHSLEGSMAIAHNGKVMNADNIRRDLEKEDSILQTTTDTEVVAHWIEEEETVPTEDAIIRGLNELVGAYAFLMMMEDKMYVALDPTGIRPLSLGRLGDAYVVASETCA